MSAKPTDSTDPYASALADLEAKKAEIEAAIVTLKRFRAMQSDVPSSARQIIGHELAHIAPLPAGPILANGGHPQFIAMTLPEASAKRIEIAGKPQTPTEIWDALQRDGMTSSSKDPVHGVHWALKRRATKVGDVVLIGRGKWGLRSWYTADELEIFARGMGGMGGRDRQVHVAKTKNAIATLKARGARWGRPISISVAQWITFLQAREAGAGVKEAASAGGFSPAVAVNLGKNYAIDQWKPGDEWPPYHLRLNGEAKRDDDGPKQMRLVQ